MATKSPGTRLGGGPDPSSIQSSHRAQGGKAQIDALHHPHDAVRIQERLEGYNEGCRAAQVTYREYYWLQRLLSSNVPQGESRLQYAFGSPSIWRALWRSRMLLWRERFITLLEA